jgi:hypothetical protein
VTNATPCDLCPFRDDPDTPCIALRDDSERAGDGQAVWCHRIDPGRAIWKPGNMDALRRSTLESLGRPVPESFPTLAIQSRNLVFAVGRFVAGGMERTTPEQIAERMAICRGCENFRDGRCLLCGCRLSLKISMATEHCPIGKW